MSVWELRQYIEMHTPVWVLLAPFGVVLLFYIFLCIAGRKKP